MSRLGRKNYPVKALSFSMSEAKRAHWSAPVLKKLQALSSELGNRLLILTRSRLKSAPDSPNDRKVSLKKEAN